MSKESHMPKPCKSCRTLPHEPGSILCKPCQALLVKANSLLEQWQEEHKELGYEINFIEQQPISEDVWTKNGYPSDRTVALWDKVNAEQGTSIDLNVLIQHPRAMARTER